MPAKKYRIILTDEERRQLLDIADAEKGSKERRKRANILLLTDESGEGAAMTDLEISRALRCRAKTVERLRKNCFEHGPASAVERASHGARPSKRKLDGEGEARLTELACSKAPEGHANWSLNLLASGLIELEVVDTISPSTVGRTLKKTS